MEDISEKAMLVSFMKQGLTAQEALENVPMRKSRSVSWAQKLYQDYKNNGPGAFIDGRWERETKVQVMTAEVVKLIIFFFLDRPAAGPMAIWKEVIAQCKKLGLPEPSYSSVKQYLASLPEEIKLLRQRDRGLRLWEKFGRPVIRFENTFYSNERWQIDDCHLPVWARQKIAGEWKPCRVYLTDALDVNSRSIPGFVLSSRVPDSWSVKLLLRKAILPKENPQWANRGIPTKAQTDNGKNFKSKELATAASYLLIGLEYNPPHDPDSNGKLERFHRTLNEGCLKRLPCHMDAVGTTYEAAEKKLDILPTVGRLREIIEKWIVEEYHQRVHSTTGRKPAELWEETVRLRMPESDDALNLLLHHKGPYTLQNTGIEITHDGVRHLYWMPDLTHYWKCKVFIRFNPDDMESVYVYLDETGEFIGEACDMFSEDPRYTYEDVKRAGDQKLAALAERLKEYFDEVERDDRPRKVQTMMREIREEQAAREADAAADSSESSAAGGQDFDPDLLAKFKALHRGEAPSDADGNSGEGE